MSRLTDLIREAKRLDPGLGGELEKEVRHLQERRAFGLNFERHQPEAVDLYGRPVRVGDKVRMLPPRGETVAPDKRLWVVTGGATVDGHKRADLRDPKTDDTATHTVDDLVVVAENTDVIYPGLVSTGRVERGGDKPFHTVINGENLHALEALLYTHRGTVDVIYIDPPYNTGAKDWKYNNDYVEKEDLYRHSKWLAFMERRLRLAKALLNPSASVLILAIDENEVHRVSLLLEQVFVGYKVQMVTVLINPAGASIIDQFSRVDEHLLFVNIGAARPVRTRVDTTPGFSTFVKASGEAKTFTWEPFQRSGGNSRRQDTQAKFFPVYIDRETGYIAGCGDHLPLGVPISDAAPAPDGCISQWPIKQDGSEACWQLSAPTFRQYLREGRVRIGKRISTTGRYGLSFLTKGHMRAIADGELVIDGREPSGALIVKNAEGKVRSQVGKTMWTATSNSATEFGSSLLNKIIPGRKFPFPKSLYAVEDALRPYVLDKPEAVIVDFFAGSGTTAHAVMRLNRQDGGTRRSILITNNEVGSDTLSSLREKWLRPGDSGWESAGICENVTKPRIFAAITGQTPEGQPIKGDYRFVDEFPMADGFEENAEFFTLTYEAPLTVSAGHAFARIAPLLWLRAGSRGRRIESLDAGWDVAEAYGVIERLEALDRFVDALREHPDASIAFVVTDDERRFQSACAALPEHVEPVRLYESYLRNFQIDAVRSSR